MKKLLSIFIVILAFASCKNSGTGSDTPQGMVNSLVGEWVNQDNPRDIMKFTAEGNAGDVVVDFLDEYTIKNKQNYINQGNKLVFIKIKEYYDLENGDPLPDLLSRDTFSCDLKWNTRTQIMLTYPPEEGGFIKTLNLVETEEAE